MVGEWIRHNASVYIGNASTKRDFRAQLRGNRAAIMWSVYLLLLIGYAAIMYSGVTRSYDYSGQGTMSVSALQGRLQEFYQQILYFLGAAIAVVAPGLTATAIVSERQRHSLDLVFSAPVSSKYYLVGKMLSSYRYTWMLLILSLPITSVCVVMGGATYADVFITYGLLSLHGLVLTSIALLVSTAVNKAAGAVVLSYCFTILYLILGGYTAGATIFGRGMGMLQSGEMPFLSQLSPFLLSFTAGTYTLFGFTEIPNWILTAVFLLLLVKLFLLGAASLLQPAGSKEASGLRVHSLIYFAVFCYAVGRNVVGASLLPHQIAAFCGWGVMPFLFMVPFITCYGIDRERIFRNDGAFSLKNLLVGKRSGALPFLLAIVVVGIAGFLWGAAEGIPADQGLILIAPYLAWIFSFWIFVWAFARWISSVSKRVATAKALYFAILIPALAVPPIIISVIAESRRWEVDGNGERMDTLWNAYPLSPIFGQQDMTSTALVWSAILLGGAALMILSERRRRPRFVTPPPYLGVL